MWKIFLKNLCFIPVTWVVLQAQAAPMFVIDQRLELIQLLNDLAVSPTDVDCRDISRFVSLRDHTAVRLGKAMPSRFRDSPMLPNWILCFGPPPEFKPLTPVPVDIRKMMSVSDEAKFLDALRDFAKQAAPLLAREDVRNQIHHTLVDDFNSAIGTSFREVNRLSGFSSSFSASASFMDGIPSGGQVTIRLGSTNEFQTIFLFKLETDPGVQQEMRIWVVLNLLRYRAENLLENITLPSIPEDSGRRWLSELQRVSNVDSPTWEMHIRKSLARALTVRVLETIGETGRAKRMLKESEARMPWVPRLISRWKELSQAQSGQVTMRSILPKLIQVFGEEDPVVTTRTRMVGVRPKH